MTHRSFSRLSPTLQSGTLTVALSLAAAAAADASPTSSSLPFEVETLQQRLLGWNGKEVLVAGYPMLFFDNDPLETDFRLHVEPGRNITEPGMAHGTMAQPDDQPISRSQVVVVRCRIASGLEPHLDMEACARVDILDALPASAATPLDLDRIGADTLVRVDDLHRAARGLIGQEVTVRGTFNGWTTSQVEGGSIHHVELQDASTGRKGIHAQLTAAPTAEQADPRRIHLVRGRITGALGQQIKLVDAAIIASDP